jgi:hypothetical protein
MTGCSVVTPYENATLLKPNIGKFNSLILIQFAINLHIF